MSEIPEEVYERFQRAAAAAFTRRYGPSADEVATWGWPKRLACRLTPLRWRWKYSSLAPTIRYLES